MKRDLVCGMEVDERSSPYRTVYDAEPYFFCSRPCQEVFDEDPGRFIGGSEAGQELAFREPAMGSPSRPPKLPDDESSGPQR